MGTIIPARGGSPYYVAPASGPAFTLAELQRVVGGYLEVLRVPLQTAEGPVIMFLNEDGKRLGLPINGFATAIAAGVLQPGDVIVGDVIVCTWTEAGEGDGGDAGPGLGGRAVK